MGQAVRKLKPPSRPVTPSEYAVPKMTRQSVDIKPAPPESQIAIELDMAGEGNRPDPNFASMSQQIVGAITTRSPGQKEHPNPTIKEEYTRSMPADRHTTLLSGPDEDSIRSPGTLNHAHIRELFLLYQGKSDSQEKPLDVASLATKFNVDVGLLKLVLHYNTLVHFQTPVEGNTSQVTETVVHQMKDTVQQLKDSEGLQVKKQPT